MESLGSLPSSQASTLDPILCHMIHSTYSYSFSRISFSAQAFHLQTIFQEVSTFEVHLSISSIHAACPVSLIVFNLSSRIILFKTINSDAFNFNILYTTIMAHILHFLMYTYSIDTVFLRLALLPLSGKSNA
jgi:hypothetical protein